MKFRVEIEMELNGDRAVPDNIASSVIDKMVSFHNMRNRPIDDGFHQVYIVQKIVSIRHIDDVHEMSLPSK